MTGREDDDFEPKTQTAIGGGQGSWGPNIHTPDDTEASTRVLSEATRRHPSSASAPGFSQTAPAARGDEERTRVLKAPTAQAPGDLSRAPVGWVVVVAGPGLGTAFPLSYGSNRLGRGQDVDVALNFGDESISRGPHCRVVYDVKGRTFYLQPGEGTGLTYMNGGPVLAPTQIQSEAEFEIGHTTLRFVPLCGAGFDWQALTKEDTAK